MSFQILNWLLVKITKQIENGERSGPNEFDYAKYIDFSAEVGPEFLDALCVDCAFPVHHDDDGDVLRTPTKEITLDRVIENYRMGISFNHLQDDKEKDKYADYFPIAKAVFKKAIPKKGNLYQVKFQVQLHPYGENDAGMLSIQGTKIGMKGCFIKLEPEQSDLADQEDGDGSTD